MHTYIHTIMIMIMIIMIMSIITIHYDHSRDASGYDSGSRLFVTSSTGVPGLLNFSDGS